MQRHDGEVRRPWSVIVELTEPRDFNEETRVFTRDHEAALKKHLEILRPPPQQLEVVDDRVTIRFRVDGSTELEAWNVAKSAAERVLSGSIADVNFYTLITKLAAA